MTWRLHSHGGTGSNGIATLFSAIVLAAFATIPASSVVAMLVWRNYGVPNAYSEDTAGKAYPNCEAIPCDQFEMAFQAIELWIADRVVLLIENSLGGSIHKNYNLLLCHRLHIVGEVQLPVHHCLLALPRVRKEYLTRFISHPQALAQRELTRMKLGLNIAREAVYDTAGADKFIAANNLGDSQHTYHGSLRDEHLADGI
nr:arogenate dehydratase/prephenate dehydratase 6, chloroplastic [Quercus suber]